MSQSNDLFIVHQDECSAFGTLQNVVVVVWLNDTLPKTVRQLSRLIERASVLHPDGVGLVQVVDERCSALSSEARAELSEMLTQHQSGISCSTVVFEGKGFRAAAVRGIVTGLALLTRVSFPHTIFASATAAVDWQHAHLRKKNPSITCSALLRSIEDVRRAAVLSSGLRARR